jgi:hypothetical protein
MEEVAKADGVRQQFLASLSRPKATRMGFASKTQGVALG